MFIYDNDLESSYSARVIHLSAGKKEQINIQDSFILFGVAGSFQLQAKGHGDVRIKENQMVFIHAGFSCTITAREKVHAIMLCFPEIIALCNRFIPEVLEQKKYTCEILLHTLPTKKYIDMWVSSLQLLISDLKNLHPLVKVKTQELFLLLKTSYPTEELSKFLCPVFSYNYEFTLFILNNYYKVRTVAELVDLSSMSLSAFEKEFRKVFDTSPYKWMLARKMRKLYYEISTTEKLLKIIADEYDFVSLSQMGDFCRKHFGASPREIRNKRNTGV